MAPLVYVIVPVFNTAEYLPRCLNSIYGQSYKNIRVVLVDDGSTDRSFSILDMYRIAHADITTVIRKGNGGLSSARNAGLDAISYSDDSVITFIDSDDCVDFDYLENMVRIFTSNDCDVVCSRYKRFKTQNPDLKVKKKFVESEVQILDRFHALSLLLDSNIQSHVPTKLYRCALWRQRRFDEGTPFMEDQRIMFEIFDDADRVAVMPYQGYDYFVNEGSLCRSEITNRKVISALDAYYRAVQYRFSCSEEEGRILYEKAVSLFASAFLMLFPRFDYSKASSDELAKMSRIVTLVDEKKYVKNALFSTRTNKWKRRVYLFSKKAYRALYRKYLETWQKH